VVRFINQIKSYEREREREKFEGFNWIGSSVQLHWTHSDDNTCPIQRPVT